MNYYGNKCHVCNAIFTESDDIVTCPVCGTPHHRECWNKNGSCINESRHADGFTWKNEVIPDERKPKNKNQNPNIVVPVQCPYCGAPNHPNELYCISCHEPIHANASAQAGDPMQDDEMREKMYNDYRNFGGLDPQSSIGNITVHEYSDYLGNKPGSYIRRFLAIQQTGKAVSWNWPAFILSAVSLFSGFLLAPAWFFYRKMNKIGAVLLALLCAASLTTAFISANDPAYYTYVQSSKGLYSEAVQDLENGESPTELFENLQLNLSQLAETYNKNQSKATIVWSYVHDILFSCILPVCIAVFATSVYKKKAEKDITNIRQQYGNTDEYTNILKKKGGTSIAGMILGLLACIVLFFAAAELPIFLSKYYFGSQI